MNAHNTRLLRGAILASMYKLYPQPTFLSGIKYVVSDFGLEESDLVRQLHYLRDRGWITMERYPILGRRDEKLTLTAVGVDVASGIDPDEPLLSE